MCCVEFMTLNLINNIFNVYRRYFKNNLSNQEPLTEIVYINKIGKCPHA